MRAAIQNCVLVSLDQTGKVASGDLYIEGDCLILRLAPWRYEIKGEDQKIDIVISEHDFLENSTCFEDDRTKQHSVYSTLIIRQDRVQMEDSLVQQIEGRIMKFNLDYDISKVRRIE